jgi:hypothetical protein
LLTPNLCFDGLSIGGKRSTNAVRKRQQDGAANVKAFVAEGVVILFQQMFGISQAGSADHVHLAWAGEISLQLQEIHPRPGEHGGF